MHTVQLQQTVSIQELGAELDGRMIAPSDAGYDEARTVFIGGIDRRPAAIVRAASARDVARVVRFGRETGLELAVRSGGHSAAGHGVTDGGIVLEVRDMRGLAIDLSQGTAWAETGLTTGEYSAAAASCRLATGFGDARSVGIGGITLAGGVGYLVRKHGLTIDHLLAAEIVTADGALRRVDAENHPDLFWAIRGGGGNFGVATRFKFRLHELEKIVGGQLFLPATPEVISAFVAAAEAAPEELSTIANVMPAPPLPFLPSEHHGRLVLMATLVHAGAGRAAERAIAPFRALAAPLADTLRPMPYPDVFPPVDDDFHPVVAMRTLFLDGVDRPAAETIIERLRSATAPMAAAQLRVLGGAVARVPAEATAFAHRDRRVIANVAAMYQRPDEREVHEAWARDFAAELAPRGTGAYVAFLGDEGNARVHEAYPGSTWERLAAIKARYDPDNLFRLNQNVPPAPDRAG
jgi:FAD/FMN-containing dehydrogenase